MRKTSHVLWLLMGPEPAVIAADPPVQPDNRLDHQLSASDERFRPPRCSESPAEDLNLRNVSDAGSP
ncbi:hypothetical protein AB0D11_43150 [Streptomyces monashensis]|uniref:hypothetical protein n=1 Tax=Streptomyces monashensis TaxID=1678012 RepID=UPI0033E4BF6B